jgi:ferredoxin
MTRIAPSLIDDIRKYGKFDAAGCFGCGSCTIACTSIPVGRASFPRRVMRYARFGLKEPLQNSLEPWLCYYCGDCADACPRQAEPAASMMTLKRYLMSYYDRTGLASKMYTSAGWRIGVNLLVGFLFALLVVWYHVSLKGMKTSDFIAMPMGIEHMFPLIIYFTVFIYVMPAVLLMMNALAMMHRSAMYGGNSKIPAAFYFSELKTLFMHGAVQIGFIDCTEEKPNARWTNHFFLVSGFVVISILVLFFLPWFQTDKIYPLYHPQRWLGYLATAALIYGSVEILIGRLREKEQVYKFSDMSDWLLPAMILLASLSGIAVHIFRYMELPLSAHIAYFIHMVIITPLLLIEIPFGKLAHVLYRPFAIYFLAVRQKAEQHTKMVEGSAA